MWWPQFRVCSSPCSLCCCMKLIAVSWMVSVPLVFSSPSPSWVPLVEKCENIFTAMPKNLKYLPLICFSHSKLYFLMSKPLLPVKSSLSSSIYLCTLAQNLWLYSLKSFRYCHTCLLFKAQMSPIPSEREREKKNKRFFNVQIHSNCSSFFLSSYTYRWAT